MAIALGVDTGGTYTDVVLVEYETNRVLASAKALTTKQDLAIGIREAISEVLAAHPSEIHLVSVSTTLATNAIVEGNGAPICALLIGYEGRVDRSVSYEKELGTRRMALIAGGHTTSGEQWQPLDLEAARAAIQEHAPHVAAFAISGFFGTRNPEHELAVRELVRELTGLPASCGHELTYKLDAMRRATTVALNARLIPLICDLIDAVQGTLAERGIHAPLMVVKGDGSLMDATLARERPIETILSGPAASVVGARHLSQAADAVVIDMGGTTTDIAVVTAQGPRLNPEGAQVGHWRTMVEAIDVHTAGLGGDSQVWLDAANQLIVGPHRIVPLCLMAAQFPAILASLRDPADDAEQLPSGDFLMLQRRDWAHDGSHPPFEQELYARLCQGPCSLEEVFKIVVYPQLHAGYLSMLERQGLVIRAGVTPTDAAHVLGLYTPWECAASHWGLRLLARRLGQSDEQALCHQIVRRTAEQISVQVAGKLLADDDVNGHHPDLLNQALIARALRPSAADHLGVEIRVRPALVAIGAPAHTYFPLVAELLHGQLIIPPYAEVANALGAVVGSVVARVHGLVVPTDEQTYRVHLPDQVCTVDTLEEAAALAEREGRRCALERATLAGAADIQITVQRLDHTAPVAHGLGEALLVQTVVEVHAVGRPRLAHDA